MHKVILNHDVTNIPSQNINDLFYYENTTHCFIGPYKKHEQDACFCCFISILKQNKSSYYELLLDEPSSTGHYEFLSETLHEREIDTNTVLIFDKQKCVYEIKKIRKDIYCPYCKEHVRDNINDWDINECIQFNSDGRVHSFNNIIEKISTYYTDLIDLDSGIGKTVFRDADSDIVPMYAVTSFIGTRSYHSYGRTKSLAGSKYTCCLEMLERYCGMVPQFKTNIFGSYEDVQKAYDDEVISPETLHLSEQTAFDGTYYINKYNPKKQYYWTECLNLKNRTKVLLPEQAIYYDNQLLRDEERYLYETSNGTALGGSLEEAIIYALLELIERDSFLVYWYTKMVPPKIDMYNEEDEEICMLIAAMERRGYQIHLFDITLETGIPTVWAMAVNEQQNPRLKVYNAAGCHLDARQAAKSALVEVVSSSVIYEKQLEKERDDLMSLLNNPTGVVSMEDHVRYYALEEHFSSFSHLVCNLEGRLCTTFTDMNARSNLAFNYLDIIRRIGKHHRDIYVANVGNYVSEKLGLFVTKIIVPSMQPMTFGVQNERLNKPRLSKFLTEGGEINNAPHPFP
jgi:ribosomal protein S12 methylthiotransferase accessory factor